MDTLDDEGEHLHAKVCSYDINEMLGTKMRALMQRTQGRDLFDLFHAVQLSEAGRTPYPVDSAKAMDAFTWYLEKEGVHLGKNEANALLDARLSNTAFRRDMDTLLRPGIPKFDVDAGASIIRNTFFMHLEP
jgi:predicted nucleotidyltransferase component of viral defense system